ncbi:MAG TPA: 2-oxoacid:acceptor oxidoreductase family protein [Syntrophorhabdales bacterium]|nr:2-oxoacid:acceptor oxidoreductase family protein [Syntrophorhabdales bacterium]
MKWEIVCTGIGGRGVLLASAVLIETATSAGYHAMASDELGMSQRGGSVVSMIKVGSFQSPFVGRENADVMLSFEESEFYRNLTFLKKGGLVVVNSARSEVPEPVSALLEVRRITCYLIDADAMANSIGSMQASNMAMLGFFSHFAMGPYDYQNIVSAIGRKVAPRLFAMNKSVFEAGRNQAEGTIGRADGKS